MFGIYQGLTTSYEESEQRRWEADNLHDVERKRLEEEEMWRERERDYELEDKRNG